MNRGVNHVGRSLNGHTNFIIGCAFKPRTRSTSTSQVKKLESKLAAGAQYVMTQPVFDLELARRTVAKLKPLGVPVFLGVMPLMSSRNAEFLHNEVPGIKIADELRERLRHCSDDAAATKIGLEVAREVRDVALEAFNGVYLITPFLALRSERGVARLVPLRARIVVRVRVRFGLVVDRRLRRIGIRRRAREIAGAAPPAVLPFQHDPFRGLLEILKVGVVGDDHTFAVDSLHAIGLVDVAELLAADHAAPRRAQRPSAPRPQLSWSNFSRVSSAGKGIAVLVFARVDHGFPRFRGREGLIDLVFDGGGGAHGSGQREAGKGNEEEQKANANRVAYCGRES